MADDKNMNDDLFGADEDQGLDAQNDMDEEYEDDEVEEDSDEFDPETGENLITGETSHIISDEAGTRLDLSDIHGGTLKTNRFVLRDEDFLPRVFHVRYCCSCTSRCSRRS